ncbi:cell division protein ZapD, partial [Salmonella enterica subsp. enterica serovar Montevideo]|nr:cell division protein ZapD [Salmonella enterica subsp. enterica serovar Montevideo]
DNGDDADLLRLMLTLDSQLYPQISGHKSRFAIRFMPLDSENGLAATVCIPMRLTATSAGWTRRCNIKR